MSQHESWTLVVFGMWRYVLNILPGNGFVRNVLPAILYVVAIFYGGSMRVALPLRQKVIPTDKVLHFVAFAGLVLVLFRAIRYELRNETHIRHVLFAFIGSVACGAALELYQAILPHRTAEFLDLVADALGAALMGAILLRAQERRA